MDRYTFITQVDIWLKDVKFNDWKFVVTYDNSRSYMQVVAEDCCNYDTDKSFFPPMPFIDTSKSYLIFHFNIYKVQIVSIH